MAYVLDRVYDTTGTELSNALHTTTLSGANNMAYDGRYLWVTCGTNGIAIYEWWGAASENEPTFETLDDLVYPRYDSGLTDKLRLVTYITVTATQISRTTCLPSMAEVGNTNYLQATEERAYAKVTGRTGTDLDAFYIVKCANKMYVTNGATFDEIFEFGIDTQNLLAVIDVQETHLGMTTEYFTNGVKYNMLSNLESANVKLWFVGQSFSDDKPQRMYSFNVLTRVKTTVDIPVRPQLTRSWLANGFNGFVYKTDYNNVSVSRFSDIDGVFGATIRTNGLPTYIEASGDRKIWVSSFGGMLTLVDFDDDGVHNDYGSIEYLQSFQVDPTDGSKVWGIGVDQKLFRQDLNNNERLEQGTVQDWEFSNPKLGTPEQLWISNQMFYQDATLTTRTIKPYMFCIADNKLVAWRLDRYLTRDVYNTVNGQGAAVVSPLAYFGEL